MKWPHEADQSELFHDSAGTLKGKKAKARGFQGIRVFVSGARGGKRSGKLRGLGTLIASMLRSLITRQPTENMTRLCADKGATV